MELINKFRLGPQDKIALVGAGGKTTLLFKLAQQYGTRVICTTTTHLALDQLGEADQHIIVEDPSQLPSENENLQGNILLVTGPEVEPNRVSGPGTDILLKLVELANRWECPLLIEADGARKLPLKAPAAHEPAIPDFVDTVFVVIGLSGLGKPLRDEYVHRAQQYSQVANLPLEGILESDHLVRVLTSPQGGLKNIPPGARKYLLINQIDEFPNWKTFYQHMDNLLDCYQAVGFSVLAEEMLLEVHEKIAGIVLAAGGSTRFGEPKQLLDWFGKPLVSHVVDLAKSAGLSPVITITGADHDAIAEILRESEVKVVCNPGWVVGQSTSISTGIDALPDDVGGVVFLLVDQPLIPVDLIQKLIQTHHRSPAAIIIPRVRDRAGNPVLFDRQVFDKLKELEGDVGGRVLFESFSSRYVPWEDPRSQLDIDTPEDYQEIRFDSE